MNRDPAWRLVDQSPLAIAARARRDRIFDGCLGAAALAMMALNARALWVILT